MPKIYLAERTELDKKGTKVRVDYHGGNVFKMGSSVLNFSDLYRMHLVSPDFTFIVYNNRAYLCSYVNVPETGMKEMRFESVINSDNRTKVSTIYVVSNDGVSVANTTVSDINSENSSSKVDEITEDNKGSSNHYPSVRALTKYVRPLTDTFVTPEMFGAAADGITDDTAALQRAIDSGLNVELRPNKTYRVSLQNGSNAVSHLGFYYALRIHSSCKFNLNNSSIILDSVNGDISGYDKYCVLLIENCTDVIVEDGCIKGDKLTHTGALSEGCHGISVYGSENVLLDNLTVCYNTGDGICLNANWTTAEIVCTSNNIKITNCTIYDSRRNGISVIGAHNTGIDNCYIYNTAGTAPQACIDVEGNENAMEDYPKNTTISNCRLFNGENSGLMVYPRQKNTVVSSCAIGVFRMIGEAELSACTIETLNFWNTRNKEGALIETPLEIFGCKIGKVMTKAKRISLIDCVVKELSLSASSEFSEHYVTLTHSTILKIAGTNRTVRYHLYAEKSVFKNSETFYGLTCVDDITMIDCYVLTKDRIFDLSTAKSAIFRNCTFDIIGNPTAVAVYSSSDFESVELTKCLINTNGINGLLFGSNIGKCFIVGNVFNSRSGITSGGKTITEKIITMNYPQTLNVEQ